MKRYKEEVDALHAPETLKEQIAALPEERAKPPRGNTRRIAAIAAVLVVVLVAGVVSTPLLFSAQKSGAAREAAYDAAEPEFYYGGDVQYTNGYADSAYAPGEMKMEDGAAYPNEAVPAKSAAAPSPVLPSGRKLIRNAELSVETKSFDDFHAALMQKTAALGGYVESSDSGAFSSMRYEHLVLRIPADSLDAFLQSVAELGTVTSQNTSVQDVTEKYIDVKSRLAALETEQETLLALLKKAEKLTDILEIQDRLTEVRGSLESYKAQLQALDSQIDYSTVTMVVNEVERVTQPESRSFFQQVRRNLSDNLYSIGQALRNFALWFLSSLPYIALWLLAIGVVIAVVLLVRRRRRR